MAILRDSRFETCSTFSTAFDATCDQCDVLENNGNLIQVWTLGPLLHTRVIGRGESPIWKFFEARSQPIMMNYGRIILLHDWTRATGYDKKARDENLEFSKQAGAMVEEIHILFDSTLLAMAASVASLLLPNIHNYSDRLTFLTQYEALRRRVIDTP